VVFERYWQQRIHFFLEIIMPKTPSLHAQETIDSPFHSRQRWKCQHGSDRSEILAFAEASGKWESIGVVQSTPCASAKAMAKFLVGLVNDIQINGDLLEAACKTLERIVRLGLNFSTEEEANEVVARIKKKWSAKAPSSQVVP
jgi:hypothetical protein